MTINELPKKKRAELHLDDSMLNMTQYYVYLLNESCVGMYFTQFLQKKIVQENFNKNVRDFWGVFLLGFFGLC